MPDRTLPPHNQLMVIAAAARETARMARETQSRATQRIAKSEQAMKEAREVADRADESLRRLSSCIMTPAQTLADPTCPNCGQPMTLMSPLKGGGNHNRFECKGCKVVYMTEDHTQINGEPPATITN